MKKRYLDCAEAEKHLKEYCEMNRSFVNSGALKHLVIEHRKMVEPKVRDTLEENLTAYLKEFIKKQFE